MDKNLCLGLDIWVAELMGVQVVNTIPGGKVMQVLRGGLGVHGVWTALFFPCAEAPVLYAVLANKKAADAALLRNIGHLWAHGRHTGGRYYLLSRRQRCRLADVLIPKFFKIVLTGMDLLFCYLE